MSTPSSEASLNLPTNRKFGFFFSAIFFLIALRLYWHVGSIGWTFFFGALTASFLLISIFASQLLTPLNKIWYRFGLALGRVVSPIVLGLIFFLILTPIALIIRIAGRDNLKMKKMDTQSYWVERLPPGPTSDSFKNQY